MTGLLKKDMMLIKKNFSFIYFIAILPPIMVSINNPNYFVFILSTTLAFLIAMQVPTTMELDERAHWEKIVLSMPVSTACIVTSKYILAFILSAITAIIVIFVSLITTQQISIVYTLYSILIVVFYNAIIIPVAYRYGTSVSKYFLILFVSIPVVVIFIFNKFNINLGQKILSIDIKILILLLSCFGIIFIVISILISMKAFIKKQFQ